MKNYEKTIRENDLMVEVWWEPGEGKFRATVRDDEIDDGWADSADTAEGAMIAAIAVYRQDTKKAS
jgi:hypothetical protein